MNQKKFIIIAGVALFLIFGGVFTYNNIIVPWPYREELKACLADAANEPSEELTDAKRNQCFRTYPHFN